MPTVAANATCRVCDGALERGHSEVVSTGSVHRLWTRCSKCRRAWCITVSMRSVPPEEARERALIGTGEPAFPEGDRARGDEHDPPVALIG